MFTDTGHEIVGNTFHLVTTLFHATRDKKACYVYYICDTKLILLNYVNVLNGARSADFFSNIDVDAR